jgi:cephalosporin-C deacetylase-like acetyl esterase
MASSDVFPVDADFVVVRTYDNNILRFTSTAGEESLRQKASAQRVFRLTFRNRLREEYTEVEKFRLRMQTDFFKFNDKSNSVLVDVYFLDTVRFAESHKEEHTFSVQLIEKV